MRILLAEDDKNFGVIIKKELEEEKYAVDLVNDGIDAILTFFDNHYDLLLSHIIHKFFIHEDFKDFWSRSEPMEDEYAAVLYRVTL
ncbi:MAG: hypothetical protein AB1390_11870 [Nitrospirota bacterium]